MNGRVYDPMLGMFLSPDNYIQAPDFTQNYNRYAYAWGNPMMYTDPSGEYIQWIIGGFIGGLSNVRSNADNIHGFKDWLAYYAIGNLAGASAAFANDVIPIPILSQAAAGHTAGLTTTTLNSLYRGASPRQSVDAGARAGLIGGGIGAGVGLAGMGLQALMNIPMKHPGSNKAIALKYSTWTFGDYFHAGGVASSVNTSGMVATPLTIPLATVFADEATITAGRKVFKPNAPKPEYIVEMVPPDKTKLLSNLILDNSVKVNVGDQVLEPCSDFGDYAEAFLFGRTYGKYDVGLDGRITGVTPTTGIVPAPSLARTLSAAKIGRAMHRAYNPGANYVLNKAIAGSKLRPDAVDYVNKIIRELKPNNPAAIQRGLRQLQKYVRELEKNFGKGWQTFLDSY